MTLSDGSKVWLNAGSSVRFPVAFTGNERKVSITGEAYFEVARDAYKPFIVKDINRNAEVQVLGTHFNVNTYDDEPVMKVTLLEGAVKVIKGISTRLLKPGQQAQVGSDVKVITGIDTEEVMAWKNGRFQFKKASLQEVMRQVARWYDVEIVYEGKIIPQEFGGKMQRDLKLSEVLEGLAKSQVHFRIEKKKVVVMP
jgi:ferric-dicitrate binding protein FerR (iron transport regulator)